MDKAEDGMVSPMGRRINSFEQHDFYCINCGEKGIPLTRQQSNQRGAFHRKLMYCWHCKHTVNHIECRNEIERQEFLTNFINGAYKDEAAEELKYEAEHPRFQNYLKEMK